MCALLFGVPATATGVGGIVTSTSAAGVPFFAVIAVLGVMVLRAAWRIVRARVVISTQAVTVAGPLRTRIVPLTEVDRFAARNAGGSQPTIALLRSDGQHSIWCWIFNRDGAIWQFKRLLKDLEDTADGLNQTLDTARLGVHP